MSTPQLPHPAPAKINDMDPKRRIDKFEAIIREDKQTFTLGGTIPTEAIDTANLALYYSKDLATSNMLKFPTSDNDLTKLHDLASPSPFGKGGETVHDPLYRQAKELKPPHFGLSSDPIREGKIASILASNLIIKEDYTVEVTMNNLNVYPTGGFFKEHRDTPLGKDHIGTLTVCLPTTFTGGELVVTHGGMEVVFDWADSKGPVNDLNLSSTTPAPDSTKSDRLVTWAFLYSDVCHQILPVTSGTRITIAYNVWQIRKRIPLNSLKLSTVGNPIKEYLLSLLCDKLLFMPNGGRIAFGTVHAYPVSHRDRNLQKIADRFKGQDDLLLGILRQLGLSCYIKAVYDVTDWDDSDSNNSDRSKAGRDVSMGDADPG